MRLIFLLIVLIIAGCSGSSERVVIDGVGTNVSFKTSDGVKIAGTYYEADGEDAPGVILLHMLSRNRGDWDGFARRLQEEGYSVLAIDLRGHGQSGLDWKKFTDKDFNDMTLDASAAKEFLVNEGLNKSRISLIGASIGANVALNYAASDEDIAGIVLLSPGLDYKGVRTEEAMEDYGTRPLLIVVGSLDTYSTESAQKLYIHLSTEKTGFRTYLTPAHGTQLLDEEDSSSMIIQWLNDEANEGYSDI